MAICTKVNVLYRKMNVTPKKIKPKVHFKTSISAELSQIRRITTPYNSKKVLTAL